MPEFKSREEYEQWKAKRLTEAKEKATTGDIRQSNVEPVNIDKEKETKMGIKKFSFAIFGLVLIAFFLPFMHLSCQGQKIGTSISGFQLITGTTMELPDMGKMMAQQPGMPGEPPAMKADSKIGSELFAIIAFSCAVLGLGLSFLKNKKSAILPAISGVAGLVMLLLLKSKLDGNITKEAGGMVQVEYDIGFWLIAVFFLLAAGLNTFIFFQKEE